jgi:hypothetical protein
LQLEGIVLTMYDTRNKLSSLVSDDVRSYFGDKVYDTVIPRNVRVSEAPSHGKPVLLYDLACTGSQAYVHLAGEVLRRDAQKNKYINTTGTGNLVPDSLRDKAASTEIRQDAAESGGVSTDPSDGTSTGPEGGTTGESR